MGKAFELDVYEVVHADVDWVVVRRADGKTARAPAGWLAVKGGKAQAVSQTKQVRIDGLDWE